MDNADDAVRMDASGFHLNVASVCTSAYPTIQIWAVRTHTLGSDIYADSLRRIAVMHAEHLRLLFKSRDEVLLIRYDTIRYDTVRHYY